MKEQGLSEEQVQGILTAHRKYLVTKADFEKR